MLRTLAAALLLFALPASAALADTLRVPKDFEDIQAALDAAQPGDTVVIGSGSYTVDGLQLSAGKDGVMIRGQGRVFIDGPFAQDAPPALEILSSRVSLRGLTFRHSEGDAVVVGSEGAPLDGFRMERCNVRNADGSGLVAFVDNALVRGCRFRGCHQGAIDLIGDNASLSRLRMEQLGAFGVRVDGGQLRYSRNIMRLVEDGRGIVVTGDGADIERSTFSGVQRQHVEVFGNSVSVIRCTFKLGDNGAIDVSGTDARIERNTIEAFGNTAIALLGQNGTIARNSVRDISYVNFDDDNFDGMPNNLGDPNCNTDDGECDTDSAGIAAFGAGTTVTSNLMQGLAGRGIRVQGDDPVVTSNRVLNTKRNALSVTGVNARVDRNVVFAGDSGIQAHGDGAAITRNVVLAAGDDSTGVVCSGDSIEVIANRVNDANGDGMAISTSGSLIHANVVNSCGAENESGLRVSGDNNEITNNRVTGCDATGLRISGDDNLAVGNQLADNSDNGIWVRADSTGNELRGNACRDNAGEGIDNGGIGTRISGNRLQNNRIDLTNRVSAGATLIDDGGNRFATGGLTTEPEVGVDN